MDCIRRNIDIVKNNTIIHVAREHIKYCIIRESVDSLCRDGADTPIN